MFTHMHPKLSTCQYTGSRWHSSTHPHDILPKGLLGTHYCSRCWGFCSKQNQLGSWPQWSCHPNGLTLLAAHVHTRAHTGSRQCTNNTNAMYCSNSTCTPTDVLTHYWGPHHSSNVSTKVPINSHTHHSMSPLKLHKSLHASTS